MYDPPKRVLVLGSSSKVVLSSPSWGALIAICIAPFEICIGKVLDLGWGGFNIGRALLNGGGDYIDR